MEALSARTNPERYAEQKELGVDTGYGRNTTNQLAVMFV